MSEQPDDGQGEVVDFFNRQQADSSYQEMKPLVALQDKAAAEVLNRGLKGKSLSIGGVWEFFAPGPEHKELTALDLSEGMLKLYAPQGVKPMLGDVFAVDFPEGTFDTVVFALILHHVAQGDWARCEARVVEALARARRWLKPGGKVYIYEYCPHPLWMPLQRALLPLTKIFLKLAGGQPLVVMHPRVFYERLLGKLFVDRRAVALAMGDEWAWFPVFMAVSWLKLPLKIYPKPFIFSATKPG